MLNSEALRRAQCVAFSMGQQERLGTGSLVRWLDPEVVKMVLEAAALLPQEGGEEGQDDEDDEDEDEEGEDDGDDVAWWF
jgi:hypothetical protein